MLMNFDCASANEPAPSSAAATTSAHRRRVNDDRRRCMNSSFADTDWSADHNGRAARPPFGNARVPRDPGYASCVERSDFRFFERLRVRWAEIDAQKIVFNAHYLTYIDTANLGYWRALALPYAQAMERLGGDLYLRKATLEYHASARCDDVIDV